MTPESRAKADTDVTPKVGQRLRDMRKIRGVSVREQARLLGVSPSTLSELERGISGISLQRLQSVATSLGIGIADLLADESASPEDARPLEIVTPGDITASTIHRGPGVHYALIGSSGDHTLQPYQITFDAGAGYLTDPIRHPGEEFVYVLFGEVNLHLGQQRHLLTAGTFARFDSAIPHAFANASTTNVAALIGAGTPPW
jgi:transcriptional regulator with XRE-family HTH domain